MRQGRYAKHTHTAKYSSHAKKRKLSKSLLVTLSLLLLLSMVTGGTVAYLITEAEQVTNTFIPGYVTCSVGTDDKVTNTGNVDAYIRAAVVVNWVDSSGQVYAIAPKYTIAANSGWTESEGYYYYASSVAPAGITATAPASVSVSSENPDESIYHLEIDYVAEAIQAHGMGSDIDNAQEAWVAAVNRPGNG